MSKPDLGENEIPSSHFTPEEGEVACMSEVAPNEAQTETQLVKDQDDGRANDPKVGTIMVVCYYGDGKANLKERRYIFRSLQCNGEPYYYSITRNRIFLLNRSRIEYFPDEKEPEDIRRVMNGEMTEEEYETLHPKPQLTEEEEKSQEADLPIEDLSGFIDDPAEGTNTAAEGGEGENAKEEAAEQAEDEKPVSSQADDPKVGTIMVSCYYGEDQPKELEKRDVYASQNCNGEPYYFSKSHDRVFVVNTSRIVYLTEGSSTQKEGGEEQKEATTDNRQPIMEEEVDAAQKEEGDQWSSGNNEPWSTEILQESSELVDEEDPKVGTIKLRIPATDAKSKQKYETRYVYASCELNGRPYYYSTTFNRIFVVDQKRINFFPDGVEPPEPMKGESTSEALEEAEETEAAGDSDHEAVSESEGAPEAGQEASQEKAPPSEEEPKEQPAAIKEEPPLFEEVLAEEEAVGDEKVGTILLMVIVQADEGNELRQVKQRRYVYARAQGSDRVYYLSKSGNRMFVLDVGHVDFFPDGVEPEEVRRLMAGELSPEEAEAVEEELQAAHAAALKEKALQPGANELVLPHEEDIAEKKVEEEACEPEDPIIGTILLRSPQGNNGVSSEKTARPVYCNPATPDKPYYLSSTGEKIIICDTDRIQYLANGPPKAESDEAQEVEIDGKKALEVLEDKKVGVIKVKISNGAKDLYPSIDQNGMAEVDVYCNYQYGEKPYYFTGTKNKIFVLDRSRIVLDNPPPSMNIRTKPVVVTK